MRSPSLLTLCILSLGPTAAQAQSIHLIPPSIETVASGGFWEASEDLHGRFRAIISTDGFEHLISALTIEWIAEPLESDTPFRTIAQLPLPEVARGGVHLGNPAFSREGHRWILTVEATNTHCDPVRIERWRVVVGQPGEATVLGSTVLQMGCT